jgi:hypothetical protein
VPAGVLTTAGLPLQDSGEVFQRNLTGLSGLLLRMDGAGASVGVKTPKHLKTPKRLCSYPPLTTGQDKHWRSGAALGGVKN